MPRTFGPGLQHRPAPTDTTSYFEDLGAGAGKVASKVGEAAKGVEAVSSVPMTPDLLMRPGAAAVVGGAKLATSLGRSAKSVPVAMSPLLHFVQDVSERVGAASINAVDAVSNYVGEVPYEGPLRALPGLLKEGSEGVWRGLATDPADPSARPEGISAAMPVEDWLRKKLGGDFNLIKFLPDHMKRNLYMEALVFTGADPKKMKTIDQLLGYTLGVGGLSLAGDYMIGEGLTAAARAPRMAYGAVRGTKVGEKALAPVERGLQAASDRIWTSGPAVSVTQHFQQFAYLPKRTREKMQRLIEEGVGAGANTESRLLELVHGDVDVIEAGARKFGMTPMERGLFLETVAEKAPPHKEFFYFDNLVRTGSITADEARYLKDGLMELFDNAVPATRSGAGLRRWTLYDSSYRAADRATDAVNRVEKLYNDLWAMVRNEYMEPREIIGGEFRFEQRMIPNIEGTRRELVRAMKDAQFKLMAYAKTARDPINIPAMDLDNMFRMRVDELLGLTNATEDELKSLGVKLPMKAKDVALRAQNLKYRAVIRENPNGMPTVRVFDKFGNQVGMYESTLEGDRGVLDAMEWAKRKYAPNSGAVSAQDIVEPATKGVAGMDQVEFMNRARYESLLKPDEVEEWFDAMRGKAGIRPVPIAELRRARSKIKENQAFWVRYIPRYESEEFVRQLELQNQLDKVNLRGLSTALGGARVTRPVVTQRQVREELLNRHAIPKRAGFANPEPLQDLTQAARTHITRTAEAVKRATFIRGVEREWGVILKPGQEVPPGFTSLGKAKGFTAGMEPGVADALRRTVVPDDVFRAVMDYDQIVSKRITGRLAQGLHKMLNFEKQYLTIVNPQFSIRNQWWNVAASWMRGNRNMANWQDAYKMLSGKFDNVQVRGMNMTYGELRRMALRENIIGSQIGMLRQEFDKVAPNYLRPDFRTRMARGGLGEKAAVLGGAAKEVAGAFPKVMSEFNQEGEAIARSAHWLYSMRDAKMGIEQARVEVGRTLFNYGKDFYTLSEAGLREVIPFYAWYRRIFPLAARVAVDQPGEYIKLGLAMNQINAMNGIQPEEFQYLGRSYMDALGIVLPDSEEQIPGTKRVMSLRGIGIADPGSIVKGPRPGEQSALGWWQGPAQAGIELLRPEIGAIGGMAMNRWGSRKFDTQVTRLPQIMAVIPPKVMARMGVEMVDGSPYGPGYWIPLFQYLAGSAGNALAYSMQDNPRAKARTVAWLSSLSIDPEVPYRDIRAGAEMRGYYEMQEEVKGFRQRAKVTGAAKADSILRELMADPESRKTLEALKLMEDMQSGGE